MKYDITFTEFGYKLDCFLPFALGAGLLYSLNTDRKVWAALTALGILGTILDLYDFNKTWDQKLNNELVNASYFGNNKRVVRLLGLGCNIDYLNKKTSLAVACLGGKITTVQLLLDRGANPFLTVDESDSPQNIVYGSRPFHHHEMQKIFHPNIPFLEIKSVGQALAIEEEVKLSTGETMKSTGCEGSDMYHRMAKFSRSFRRESLKGKEQTKIFRRLEYALNFISDQRSKTEKQIISRIQRGMPTFIKTGFINHTVIVLIWKKHFILCNRGGESRKSIEVYKIDENKHAISNTVKELLKSKDANQKHYVSSVLNQLLKQEWFSNSKIENDIEKTCLLPNQTVGNCSWSSMEAGVWAYLTLSQFSCDEKGNLCGNNPAKTIQQADQLFQEWLSWQQQSAVVSYLQHRSVLPEDFTQKVLARFEEIKALV